MKLAFPVETDKGLESEIYSNFGDANGFIVYDKSTDEAKYIENHDLNHTANNCNPVKAFGGEKIDAVILSGIGPAPLMKLQNEGIQVIRANIGNVRENIAFFNEGALICLTAKLSCGAKNVTCMCDCG